MLVAIPYEGAMPNTSAVTKALKVFGKRAARSAYIHCRNRHSYCVVAFDSPADEIHFALEFRDLIVANDHETVENWWQQAQDYRWVTETYSPYMHDFFAWHLKLHGNYKLHPWQFDRSYAAFVDELDEAKQHFEWQRVVSHLHFKPNPFGDK